ncbi:5'-3' exonuclease H3TH domain-containing protein [Aneurinibacillus sp. Ricciae_BoGa-3]|uniref:5'-3' exonuclease n=1 Tax=Aneurinibacillus sp. Ricciae_BoGa-3 TaxID=3022697 RepID=UPI0023419740|nr:5'-3' exonuclease H3TH domain-containing protein [Aneurinibacillus sp. Ricciae_BoGa-3]WCK53102.1 5'-3' exonuclease H3TH domain-containing protein [Aneurinibacillus sp. Ricciae_BoGa-3]
MPEANTVLLVDGMSLLFRAYYATSYSGYIMKTSTGIPTNAIYGFVKYFWDAVQTLKPTHVVCCWDMGSKTFRNDLYQSYKGNRSEPPDELLPQFDLVKEVVSSFGVPNIGLKGYEADDCIGTLSRHYCGESHVRILTSDRDSLQLVTDRVHSVIMKKGLSNYVVYTPELLFEEMGITPEQFIDLKGLMGDPSDYYPGVRGIGEKTALKLLKEHQSIEGILENIALLPNGIQKKIEEDIQMLHLSRQLARIKTDVPIVCSLNDCGWKVDYDRVKEQFERFEFKGLMKLLAAQAPKTATLL